MIPSKGNLGGAPISLLQLLETGDALPASADDQQHRSAPLEFPQPDLSAVSSYEAEIHRRQQRLEERRTASGASRAEVQQQEEKLQGFERIGCGHQSGDALELGLRCHVQEELPNGRHWDGIWTRRGHSNVFDAEWRDSLTGRHLSDVIEQRKVSGNWVTLYRRGVKGSYHGRISPEGDSARGYASWYPEGAF